MKKNVLITGLNGAGKSTHMRSLVASLKNKSKVGFLAKEIRNGAGRVGFKIEASNGTNCTLAHTKFTETERVSKYGVNVKNLEMALDQIPSTKILAADTVVYIDEIGEMQLFSKMFQERVTEFVNSENTFIATVSSVYDHPFITSLKQRNDIILVTVTLDNRNTIGIFLEAIVKKITKAKKYLQEPQRFNVQPHKIMLRSEHGLRTIVQSNGAWSCDCNFFKEWGICSHFIATEELMLEQV